MKVTKRSVYTTITASNRHCGKKCRWLFSEGCGLFLTSNNDIRRLKFDCDVERSLRCPLCMASETLKTLCL
jgi:hypothetical protein